MESIKPQLAAQPRVAQGQKRVTNCRSHGCPIGSNAKKDEMKRDVHTDLTACYKDKQQC